MGRQDNNWERFYQKLNLIFHGTIAFSLIPFGWVFLETQKDFPEGPVITGNGSMIFKSVLVIAAAGILGYSRVFARKMLKKSHERESIKEKLDAYLAGKVKYYAFIELSAVLAVAGLYLTKDQLFSLVYVLALFVFSLGRPSFDRVSRETGVKEKDLKNWAEGKPDV